MQTAGAAVDNVVAITTEDAVINYPEPPDRLVAAIAAIEEIVVPAAKIVSLSFDLRSQCGKRQLSDWTIFAGAVELHATSPLTR